MFFHQLRDELDKFLQINFIFIYISLPTSPVQTILNPNTSPLISAVADNDVDESGVTTMFNETTDTEPAYVPDGN